VTRHGDQRLRATGHAQRLENGGDVDFHRPLGEPEQFGNFAIRTALDHQRQHIALTAGQPQIGRCLAAGCRNRQTGTIGGRQRLFRHIDFTFEHLAQGIEQSLAGIGLGHKPRRPRFQGRADGRRVVIGGNDDDRQRRESLTHQPETGEPVDPRQGEIEQNEIVFVGRTEYRAAAFAV